MRNIVSHFALFLLFFVGVPTRADDLYFPPANGQWETVDQADVGWDKKGIQEALDFAGSQRSTGVVILHRGRILAEQYWKITGETSDKFDERFVGKDKRGHNIEDVASVQKSVVSFLVGIAQQKELLKLDDSVSQYLGKGWSRVTPKQEQAIKIRHLITMTSGLDDRGRYESDPGTKWSYNTPAYARTVNVLTAAAKMDRHELTRQWLTQPIGMTDSTWVSRGADGEQAGNSFGFATTARDLARFGLLVSAGGKWGDDVILSDQEYLKASTSTSQKLNPRYGYLWWVRPNSEGSQTSRRPSAALDDMFAAKGRLIRRCYVVPSLDLVVTRLGDQPKAGKAFDNRFWKLLLNAAPRSAERK